MNITPLQLQFYTKSECPLCDEAKLTLKVIEMKLPYIAIEEIDITKDLGLYTQYKLLIPVLEIKGKQLFTHRINSRKLIWQLRWFLFKNSFTKNE